MHQYHGSLTPCEPFAGSLNVGTTAYSSDLKADGECAVMQMQEGSARAYDHLRSELLSQ